jgi:hypothetical protein
MSGEAGIAKYASVQILRNSKFIIRYSIFALISLPPSRGLPDKPLCGWSIHYIGKPPALPEGPDNEIFTGIAGGGSRIRTHEGVTPLTVFKTAAFNHSAIPPRSK